MHETIIAKQILAEARKKAKGKPIKSIILEVGDLAHLPAGELREVLCSMTYFKVVIKKVKAKVKCGCGYVGEPKILAHEHDFVLFECPKCRKTPRVLKGQDIVIKQIKA